MYKKNRLRRAGAVLLLLVFIGTALTGCMKAHRGKIELPETAPQAVQRNESEEIVIVIEPEAEDETELTNETEAVDEFFFQEKISEEVWRRMNGRSYHPGCPVSISDLRYLHVLHYDYEGRIREGELVANQSVSDDLLSIFRRLFDARYPIEKMVLIDEYGGDDELSSRDNNTSCFNFRMVAGTHRLSRHALGTAIDINPVRNPYITADAEGNAICMPSNGSAYMDRTADFDYKIDENDLCCRLFLEYGFTWGGNWAEPDYMHFSR